MRLLSRDPSAFRISLSPLAWRQVGALPGTAFHAVQAVLEQEAAVLAAQLASGVEPPGGARQTRHVRCEGGLVLVVVLDVLQRQLLLQDVARAAPAE